MAVDAYEKKLRTKGAYREGVTVLNHKRTSNPKVNDIVGIVAITILLAILPSGIGYMSASIFRFSVWSSIFVGLASSIVVFLSLVFLLGATLRFPDHLPGSENDLEV